MKNRIRELRKAHNCKQAELAAACNVNTCTVSCWELDRFQPSPSALELISNFFAVPVDFITGKQVFPETIGDMKDADEISLLSLYRSLDSEGRVFALRVLKRESQRISQAAKFDRRIEDMQALSPSADEGEDGCEGEGEDGGGDE